MSAPRTTHIQRYGWIPDLPDRRDRVLAAPPETVWQYVIPKFRTRPPAAAYRDGARHQALLYQRVPRLLEQLQGCLADGFPFVFGFSVYESFESGAVARSGVVPMPRARE